MVIDTFSLSHPQAVATLVIMLKRVWIVVSILWVIVGGLLLGPAALRSAAEAQLLNAASIVGLILVPILAGPLIVWISRIIVHGSPRPPEERS